MKIIAPMMIQDQRTSYGKGMDVTENVELRDEAFFLDGPVTKRIAVIDFDPRTGEMLPGARFEAPPRGRKLGSYVIPYPDDVESPEFIQVNAYATVKRTMDMFAEPDALGRRLEWAFNGPQLLVLPRAGKMANAYYQRASRSLQFYYIPHPRHANRWIYTSLSRDNIAHETGHAILDGIAPDLLDSWSPQSLALHEAIADLTALLMALRSRKLREKVLDQTRGSIECSSAFNAVAEEFADSTGSGRGRGLRDLLNERTLNTEDDSVNRYGHPNRVSRSEPHELSEVLTGAMYRLVVLMYRDLVENYQKDPRISEKQAWIKALAVASERFKRICFRALDYLPPGEITFADYGRAVIAADQASHPDDESERQLIRDEFLKRGMVLDDAALDSKTDYPNEQLQSINLNTLVRSDWSAYRFAEANRKLLGVPAGLPFEVRPRMDSTKTYYHRDGKQDVRECIFKVVWSETERNPEIRRMPRERQVQVGTTLAIDWRTRRIRVLLTSDRSCRPEEAGLARRDRDAFIQRLVENEQLYQGKTGFGPDGLPRADGFHVEVSNGVVELNGAARTLV